MNLFCAELGTFYSPCTPPVTYCNMLIVFKLHARLSHLSREENIFGLKKKKPAR